MPSAPRLRQAVRAVVLDPDHRVLLVRFDLPREVLWATPGGGLEQGEGPRDALRRELAEETGLLEADIGPEVWTRTHLFAGGSHDGQTERYFLVRTEAFDPSPVLPWEELRREYVTSIRWWGIEEMMASTTAFVPRQLPRLVRALVDSGPPPTPIDAGE